jgi:hypothetical protein
MDTGGAIPIKNDKGNVKKKNVFVNKLDKILLI